MQRISTGVAGIFLASALTATAWAQTPPANATDITQMTAAQAAANAATPATPAVAPEAASASIAAPASVLRIYIDTLSGADANSVQALITQALYDSKQVVVTENQSNASLILKGTVWRQALPSPKSASTRAPRRHRGTAASESASGSASAAANAAPTTAGTSGVTDITALLDGGASGSAASAGAEDAGLGSALSGPGALALPGMTSLDTLADLTHFQYRLDLRVVNPEGDLVWMSGRGPQAPAFADADEAVHDSVTPLLTTLKSLSAAPAPSNYR